MARTKGTYILPANIELEAGAPLDARSIVKTKADLTASGQFPYPYIGMETYVISENKKYRLIALDTTNLANWEEDGSSDIELIEISLDDYQELSQDEKEDPDKVYFIYDYPEGDPSSIIPNPSGVPTNNLEKIAIDNVIYRIKDVEAVQTISVGAANGVAELDENGKVPSAQLPSYVDDVVEGYYDTTTDRFYEESTFTTVIPPEDGKSWVDVASNKSYRWTGSVYVRVDEGVQLGETSNTAYRGDRGKTAYDHATESGKISSSVASGLYKIAATAQGHIASLTAAVKADFTALGLLDKSGDTMTGDLTVRADVIIDNDSNGGGHDLMVGHANASDSEQPCYIKFYRGKVSATTSLQAQQNINYDPNTGTFTPDANNYNILLPCKNGTVALISDIEALDGVITGSAGAGKTLTAFSQTDGKISATFSDISITKSQISDFPTIPTVNNSTITIKKNGTTVDSFTLNQSTGKDIDISVPTKTSDLTNDSGFVTTDEKVTAEGVDPSTETIYRGLFVPDTGATNNQKPKAAAGVYLYLKNGSSSNIGYAALRLGNSTASGTAGNKYGELWMYSEKSGYVKLRANANSTSNRVIYLPDKAGTIALTSDLTTYAFAEGTNNGEIKITPSVGGTAQTAVTVKPKGISDLAYIAKGSGSSKFLREDGTWQTVTASWSGGTITQDIIPSSNNARNLGSSSKMFGNVYTHAVTANQLRARQQIWLGDQDEQDGYLTIYQYASSNYISVYPPSNALADSVDLYWPSNSGTLLTNKNVMAFEIDLGEITTSNINKGAVVFKQGYQLPITFPVAPILIGTLYIGVHGTRGAIVEFSNTTTTTTMVAVHAVVSTIEASYDWKIRVIAVTP